MKIALAVALALSLCSIKSTDSVVLSVDRDHPTDAVGTLLTDPKAVYTPTQVEVASTSPFCIAIVYATGDSPPQQVWKECYQATYMTLDLPPLPVNPMGGPGHTISLVLSSPVVADASRMHAIARLILTYHTATAQSTADAGAAPTPTTPDAGRGIAK
jgi:hypothetical protein